MGVKVSIIIPVYNTEKYLRECLDSIKMQNYVDLEVLMVDDGSKDGSGMICEEYSDIDNRFITIHQQNSGVSSARNTGLSRATGEWVFFIDSDDWIEPDFVFSYTSRIKNNVDLIYGGYTAFGGDRAGIKKCEFKNSLFIDSDLKNAIPDLLSYCMPWGKMFRMEIIKQNNLLFNELLSLSEDRLFLYQYMSLIKGVAFINYAGYHYRVTDNSLMSKKYPIEVEQYRMDVLNDASKEIRQKWHLSFFDYLPFYKIQSDFAIDLFVKNLKIRKSFRFYKEYKKQSLYNEYKCLKPEEKIFVSEELGKYSIMFSKGNYFLALFIVIKKWLFN